MNKPIDFETAVDLKGIYSETTLQKYCENGVLTTVATNNTLPAPTYIELLDWLSQKLMFVSVMKAKVNEQQYKYIISDDRSTLNETTIFDTWQDAYKAGIKHAAKLYTDYIKKRL
jgi:hypothetical protein